MTSLTRYGNLPQEQFYDDWLGKLKEVTDGYRPDLIYFDGLLSKIPEGYHQASLAYYLNRAHAWGRDGVMTHKNDETISTMAVVFEIRPRTDTCTA